MACQRSEDRPGCQNTYHQTCTYSVHIIKHPLIKSGAPGPLCCPQGGYSIQCYIFPLQNTKPTSVQGVQPTNMVSVARLLCHADHVGWWNSLYTCWFGVLQEKHRYRIRVKIVPPKNISPPERFWRVQLSGSCRPRPRFKGKRL